MIKKFEKFATLLNSHDVRGRLIQDVAFIDILLGVIISMYFTRDDRHLLFHSTIMDKMAFYQKIEILREIVNGKPYKSAEVVQRLNRIRKLRNAIAHTNVLSTYEKIFKDEGIINILSNYPESYKNEIEAIKRQLRRLGDTKEFSGVNSA